MISTLGNEGEERFIAPKGRRPRFSPYGKEVAYTVGAAGSPLGAAGMGSAFVVASTGGPPRQLAADSPTAAWPLWSPDGKRLLVLATGDWRVVASDGGSPVNTVVLDVLRRQGLRGFQHIGDWLPNPDRILFSASAGDTTNLWQAPLAPNTWQIAGPPQRLASGTGREEHPSAALGRPGRLVFSSISEAVAIWQLPIDANQGKPAGEIKRLTEAIRNDGRPSLSADGSKLAFVSNQSGGSQVWLKDLATGREAALTTTLLRDAEGAGVNAAISPDGSKVAYSVREGGSALAYVVPIGAKNAPGVPEKVCENCPMVQDWTSDGKKLLLGGGGAARQVLLDVASRKQTELRADLSRGSPARLSPDDRWVAFQALVAPGRAQLFVAPVLPGAAGGKPTPVSDGQSWNLGSYWSPNGQLLYYLSDRDGSRCLWAQRLDAATKQPLGGPFAVCHFHNPRRTPIGSAVAGFTIAVTRNQISLPLNDRTGNIWMGELEGRPQ